MNIGIDARILNDKMTGINRYLWNLLHYIPLFDNKNKYFLYTYEGINYKNDFYSYFKIKRRNLPRQIYEHLWLNFVLPKHLVDQQIDIFFTPYVLVPFKKSPARNIIVIHDVMTKVCPQFFSYHYKKYMDIIVPLAIKRGDAIITVSKSAREDILTYYDVVPEKVHYVHLWADEKYKPISLDKEKKEFLLKKFNLPEKFVLFVGAIEERKNIRGILRISDILYSKGIDIKFVLVGKESFGFAPLFIEINKRKNRIIYYKYIDEETLPLLYNLSTIFLFPSYYEGFGLPPLEAMKCGVPVLASNNSSLKEVVGEGGILYEADNLDSFVQSIIALLHDDDFYNRMKSKAIQQAKNFSAELQMPELIDIFNKFYINY